MPSPTPTEILISPKDLLIAAVDYNGFWADEAEPWTGTCALDAQFLWRLIALASFAPKENLQDFIDQTCRRGDA